MSKNNQKTNVYSSKEGYDLWAKQYNDSRAILEAFEKGRFMMKTGDLRGKKAIDLGAGTGRITESLLMNGADVYSLDVSEKMIEILKKDFPQAKAFVGDVFNMPFEDDFFDLATAGFLLVHLKDPRMFFREVNRVLKPGGVFILSNINQKKAPKLRLNSKEEIVIKSFYHRPQDIISMLQEEVFTVENEDTIEEDGIWINQIITCRK
ncbi:MAG: class I SAM-dependent methyltransferase [Candidatus Gracilibacteria bacterium]|jgi:ubiquinone/menaquinone biosynthesis C-methylase UbiE|nr:class I SAM-dependent methyltransferase [Candidatus Gracilibacteria bacterium]